MNDIKNILIKPMAKIERLLTKEQAKDIFNGLPPTIIVINGKPYAIIDGKNTKVVAGIDYSYIFDKTNGNFKRWGKTYADDPNYSPIGPEILDLEISVNGCPNNCRFCYKNNSNEPATNMTLETFQKIISKFPKTLGQVAFGITGVQTNPDFIPMMKHCRKLGIIPNFTLSGIDLTDELASKISKLTGALAVSAYQNDKNICYNTVKKFVDLGVNQTNIHLLVSKESLDFVYEVLNDRIHDTRLTNMGAIVFLGVKPKGRAKNIYHSVSTEEYQKIIEFCFAHNLTIGFDSCSCPKFELAIQAMNLSDEDKKRLISYSESCESFGLFSSYLNVFGSYFPCSFAEGEGEWKEGINVVDCEDFLKDIWYNEKLNRFRKCSLNTCYSTGCRKCLIFDEINP